MELNDGMWVFSLFLFLQEKELTGFITDFLQEAYTPAVNGKVAKQALILLVPRSALNRKGCHLGGLKAPSLTLGGRS